MKHVLPAISLAIYQMEESFVKESLSLNLSTVSELLWFD